MSDKSTMRSQVLGPPPCPAPVPDTMPAALLQVLRADLLCEVPPRGLRRVFALARRSGPVIAVLGTCTLLATMLALYMGLCVAIFAMFERF